MEEKERGLDVTNKRENTLLPQLVVTPLDCQSCGAVIPIGGISCRDRYLDGTRNGRLYFPDHVCIECTHDGTKTSPPRPCDGCGRPTILYYAGGHKHIFCSRRCENHHYRAPQRMLRRQVVFTCKGCEKSFSGKRADVVYCSNACRQRDYRRRKVRI